MNKIVEIRNKLDRIRKKLEENQDIAKSNQDVAITLCHFITSTVGSISPEIEARWRGSYKNRDVEDFPNVTIEAYHWPAHIVLAEWRINTGGKYPPPIITAEDIISDVLEGLNRIQLNE